MRLARLSVLALVLAACGGGGDDDDDVIDDIDANSNDGGASFDAPSDPDAAAGVDATGPDATPTFALTVSAGAGGTVTSAPGVIDCGATCSDTFDADSVVTLTATPDVDHGFESWTGDCAGVAAVVDVTMDADKSCTASFTGTSGDIEIIDPPVSVVPNATEDDTNILLFVEQADMTLAEALPIDVHVPDAYSTNFGTITDVPAGTRVTVYFLHFDPVGTSSVDKLGTITFPREIIGLIVTSPTLDTTDALVGRSDIVYPAAGTATQRGLEFSGQDDYIFGDDRRTLTVDFTTSTVADQIRIVTVAPGETRPFLASTTVSVEAPPADVTANTHESNAQHRLFDESAVTLAADVATDLSAPGNYTSPGSVTPGTVGSGTAVRSVLVHFDTVGTALVTRNATVSFDRDILGVVIESTALDDTDAALGSSTTIYPAAGVDTTRGLELGGTSDRIFWSGDGRSLRITLRAQNAQDQLRILLAD